MGPMRQGIGSTWRDLSARPGSRGWRRLRGLAHAADGFARSVPRAQLELERLAGGELVEQLCTRREWRFRIRFRPRGPPSPVDLAMCEPWSSVIEVRQVKHQKTHLLAFVMPCVLALKILKSISDSVEMAYWRYCMMPIWYAQRAKTYCYTKLIAKSWSLTSHITSGLRGQE